MVAKDEKQQWNAMCKVCKTKFLVGFFVRTFLVCLAGTASVSAAHLARTLAVGRTWSVSSASPTAIFDSCCLAGDSTNWEPPNPPAGAGETP